MADAAEETLEVGRLHLGLIAGRRIALKGRGGMNELLGLVPVPQASPYCKITLGDCELSSNVGVRTTAGHAWNREQMAFPVKVPLSCIIGASGPWHHPTTATYSGGGTARGTKDNAAKATNLQTQESERISRWGTGEENGPNPSSFKLSGDGKAGALACGSSISRAAAAVKAAAAQGVYDRLMLKVQVFHKVDDGRPGSGAGASKAAGGGRRRGRGGATAGETALLAEPSPTAEPSAKNNSTSPTARQRKNGDATNDREAESGNAGGDDGLLLGECSLDLVELVCGRVPHVEEWVPLSTEGDLRLSLDYDSVGGGAPTPGDSVVLLCLSNRLDFYPLPVWEADDADFLARPGAPSWLWPRGGGASLRRSSSAGGSGGEGFRVEEAGDEFFLISYPTPEGWRCAVEVHRFLVHLDPAAPRRWTLSGVRDHAVATPAAAALREAVLSASQEESILEGGKGLALTAIEGVTWTAARWWSGGLARARDDVYFALGLTDADSFAESEERWRQEQQQQQQQGAEGDENDNDDRHGGHEPDASEQRDLHQDQERRHEHHPNQPLLARGGAGEDGQWESRGVKTPSVLDVVGAASDDQSSGGGGSGGSKSGGITTPRHEQREHLCPITRCPMEDPAVACDGITYERAAIERWLSQHDTSPVTGKVLETKVVFKNWSLVSSFSPPTTNGP